MEINDPTIFLHYLASTHQRTRRVIACIPPDDIEWTPTAGKFSFGDLVRHLANIERYMYAENVHGKPSRYAGQGRECAEGHEATIAYYDRLHEESRVLFAALSAEQMHAKCVTPAGVSMTTYKWLRAMFEHEAHHRGQLYLMLGLRGVATPPLYGLTAEELAEKSRVP